MPKGIIYDNDFMISGGLNTRITPNFRIKEFAGRNNKLYIHRELVSTLQDLRDDYGSSISIAGVNTRQGLGKGHKGLFVWLKASDIDLLKASAGKFKRQGYIQRIVKKRNQLYVQMPAVADLPALPAEFALERAILLTSAYETSGDPFQQVTGNFDGAGLSFGPLQVNLKTRTFHRMFEIFRFRNEEQLIACFDKLEDYYELLRVLQTSIRQQIAWADKLSTGRNKYGFKQPWKGYLQNIGRVPEFREGMLNYAYDVYGKKLVKQLSWLDGLWPMNIQKFPALAALYDVCVQQGGLEKAHSNIRKRVLREQPDDEIQLVHIAVEERGKRAYARWRADCISRRLGILYREPKRIYHSAYQAYRDNPKMYLLRNLNVKGAEKYLNPNEKRIAVG